MVTRMLMFKNIIAALCALFGNSRLNDKYTSIIFLVVALQQFWLFILIALLKGKVFKELSFFQGNEFYFVPVSIIWALAFFRFYPRKSVEEIAAEFNKTSRYHKLFWIILTIILSVTPFIIVLFYF